MAKPGMSAGHAAKMRVIHESTMQKAIIARGLRPVNDPFSKTLEQLAADCQPRQHYIPAMPIPRRKMN